jgi:Geranylgeranyl pyrophosphate synthase
LENMHIHKTGALIRASVELGALSSEDIDSSSFERVSHYAKCIGLAFQIHDDILDIEGETAVLGKPQGSDRERNKPTYPGLLGLEGARKTASDLREQAIASLSQFDHKADTLRWLADYIVQRER